jgi:DNA-binding PucR family transcriptional regulator
MENAKKFFEELIKTDEAKAIFATMGKPESDEEIVAAYIDVAKKLGVELTAEEVDEYLAAVGNISYGELDDEELEQLVGGRYFSNCFMSYKQKQNCWFLDACDGLFIAYDGYLCYNKNANPAADENFLDKFDVRTNVDFVDMGNGKNFG